MDWRRVIEVTLALLEIAILFAMIGVATVVGLRVMEDVFQ